ncbi:MAG TPA: thioredoxin domain-containing protein [Anaerolineales bacterium]
MVNPVTFFEELNANPMPVVVDVWAPWCMPCRAIEASLQKLGEQYAGRVEVWKVNADESPALVQSLDVRSIPTVI